MNPPRDDAYVLEDDSFSESTSTSSSSSSSSSGGDVGFNEGFTDEGAASIGGNGTNNDYGNFIIDNSNRSNGSTPRADYNPLRINQMRNSQLLAGGPGMNIPTGQPRPTSRQPSLSRAAPLPRSSGIYAPHTTPTVGGLAPSAAHPLPYSAATPNMNAGNMPPHFTPSQTSPQQPQKPFNPFKPPSMVSPQAMRGPSIEEDSSSSTPSDAASVKTTWRTSNRRSVVAPFRRNVLQQRRIDFDLSSPDMADYFGANDDDGGSSGDDDMDSADPSNSSSESGDGRSLGSDYQSDSLGKRKARRSTQKPRRRRRSRQSPWNSRRASTVADLEQKGTFVDQLFAVLVRVGQQLWRQKFDLFLELLVPLLFIIITVILWGIWGTEHRDEMIYVDFFNGGDGVVPDAYAGLLCYGTDNPVPHLQKCMFAASCDGDDTDVPLKNPSICVIDGFSFGEVVTYFLNALTGYPSLVPPLDTMIINQWVANLSPELASKTAIGSGFVPNTRFSAIRSSGLLFFVGERTAMDLLVDYFNSTSSFFPYVYGGIFGSMAEAEEAMSRNKRNWAVIEAKAYNEADFDVVIHVNSTALPPLKTIVDSAYPGGYQFDAAELYVASGYLTLMQMVSDFYINHYHNANFNGTYYIASQDTPPFNQTPLLIYARNIVPLVFALAFLYSVSQQTKKIVLEKELRLREAMLIMGVQNSSLYLTNFLVNLAVLFVICILCTLVLKLTFITQSDVFTVFLIFFLFALTTIPLSGLIAAFFSKARLASLMAPVIYFILVIPTFAMTNARGSFTIGFSIFSPSGFAAISTILLSHELAGGFGSAHFKDPGDNCYVADLLAMVAADFFIYYILMLYLDAVLPKEYGTPSHPLFFIIEPYRWLTSSHSKRLEGGPDGRAEDGVFEPNNPEEDVVRIEGLRKSYYRNNKKFLAVNNLYWGMKEGEISVLLGHNGAGKTTVLNMMTGMTEPTAGDCYIYGLSVRTQLSKVRQQIGFCPQHNILWPELTCREHLEFFGKIKGLKGWDLEDAVCRMLYETDLLEKMEQPSRELSGGQKRKLSVAIAFVGTSRLVFLDEPTAGLDVGARRYTWELLRRMSQQHTIMLTTHYMDEADLLGHRIGIMSQGRLKCSGSSMFLKSKLGVGYCITISVDPEIDVNNVDNLIFDNVDGSDVLGHNGCELSYRLPKASVGQFPALLGAIESTDTELGIRGYSLSATTLEEVFLKVSEEDIVERHDSQQSISKSGTLSEASAGEETRIVWSCEFLTSNLFIQLQAMFIKRFWNALRDRRMQCFQIICPVACILIAMLLNLIKFGDPMSLDLSYDMFEGSSNITLHTAQCFQLWGNDPTLQHATVEETHIANVDQLSLYLLDTWYTHSDQRYGQISCLDQEAYNILETPNSVVMLYNSSSKHQVGLNMATFYDLFLRNLKGASHSMKYGVSLFPGRDTSQDALTFIIMGALLMIPFTFLPSNPVAWVVKERECGARHLQDLCGLRFSIYWLCNFVFDICAYYMSMILCIIIFLIFNRQEFIGKTRVGATFVLFIVYGHTSTAAAYLLSFLFNEHSKAQTIVMSVSFVSGFLLVMIVYVLTLMDSTVSTSNTLRWIFRLVPSYCIGEGLINLNMLTEKIAVGSAKSAWDMDQLGWLLVYMSVEFPLFCIATLVIDHPARRRWFQSWSYHPELVPEPEGDVDSDVEEENIAVHDAELTDDNTDMVRVVDLQKVYANGKRAVKGITFSIFPGEVFGFLGTNGAGKTTTISILCQEFLPTSGSAMICGYNVVTESAEALQCIGYCPQFDATLDLLTVEEHIYLYARIRGIVREQHKEVLEALLKLCELTTYRKMVAAKLSGGNRRKLSVALSIVGGPQVVFLDEPSAGMDPVARRGLWTAIQKASRNCSVVLTTHHLEEVEALADIVAIMVDGTLRCIGDKIHLKNKYGSGFEMSIRVLSPAHAPALKEFIANTLPDATLNEFKGQRFVYQLPRDVSLSWVFQVIQENKAQLNITDYTVSQTSIEQVFLRISKETGEE